VQVEGRAVTWPADGGGSEPERPLLGHFDAPPDDLPPPNSVHPTFSQHGDHASEELWVVLHEPARTLCPTGLLVCDGKECETPRQALSLFARFDEGPKVGNAEALVVDRTPSVDRPIFDAAPKRLFRPTRARRYDIGMVKQDDCLFDLPFGNETRVKAGSALGRNEPASRYAMTV
jgi:hypothetical protein